VICLRNSSSIGSSSVSYCRATVEVVLKHPVIVFIAIRCTVVRLLICEVIGELRVSFGLCQMGAPYCIRGFMTAVYNLFAYLKGVPHVILAMLDSATANLVPFFLACSRWAWNFSFGSKTTPRYRACSVGEMVMPFSWIAAPVSSLEFLVKWMSMYFDGSNWAPCLCFHSSLLARIVCSRSTLPWAVNPLTPYAISSMKPRARSGTLVISSSSALYSMNRIGDNGDPCGIPASMFISLDVVPLNRSCVVHPVRKLCISLTSCMGTCLLFMLWIRQLWWTLLNAPAMSMKITEYISCRFHELYTFSVSIVIASSVVCCRCPPNRCRSPPKWFAGSKSCVSIRQLSDSMTMLSRILPIVFSSAIGLYAFGLV